MKRRRCSPGSRAGMEAWRYWTITGLHGLPGLLAGLVVGWFVIRPVNAVLGWLFRGFNRFFDWLTAGYAGVVGLLLKLSVIVMLVYGGLLALTGWQFVNAPIGFVPQQDKGYLILTVQLQDAASVERTERTLAKINRLILKDRDNPNPDIPGVAHTIAVSGQSVILNATAPNLGSMYVLLKEFQDRPSASAIAEKLAEALSGASAGGAGVRLRWAADRWPGHDRGLQAHHQGPHQPRSARSAAGGQPADRREGQQHNNRAEGPGEQLPSGHALALPRHRPRPVPGAGRAAQ